MLKAPALPGKIASQYYINERIPDEHKHALSQPQDSTDRRRGGWRYDVLRPRTTGSDGEDMRRMDMDEMISTTVWVIIAAVIIILLLLWLGSMA